MRHHPLHFMLYCAQMFNANYHSHSKYCHHASGELTEYAEEAVKAGLKEIGISDHIPLSEKAKEVLAPYIRHSGSLSLRMDFVDLPSYLSDIASVKSAFKNQLNVLAGFESEYNEFDADYYRLMREKVDYLNLGIHYVYNDGILYDFMDNKVHEDGGIRRIEKKDVMVYAENCIAALDSKLFSQMVHPDVFMRCIRAEDFDSRMEECSRAIIESAVKNEVCLEINTSDIFRSSAGFCRLRYPAENFWKIVSGYKKARILIGTDAHEPERIADFQMEYVSDFMERFKLKVEPAMKI